MGERDLGFVLVELKCLIVGRYLEMGTQRFENTLFVYNSINDMKIEKKFEF